MIENILEKLEDYKYSHLVEHDSERIEHCKENEGHCEGSDCFLCLWDKAIEIVKEVANVNDKKILNRCDTCTHYVADKVPPICYFCCKGMEDNYKARGEET